VLALAAEDRRTFALGMFSGQLARARTIIDGGDLGRRAGSRRGRPESHRALAALEYMQAACGWLGWVA
jgi:hypothetical protein